MVRKSLIAAAFLLPLIALSGASNAGPSNAGASVQPVQIAPDAGFHWVYRGGPKATPSWEKK
jgi:hypothetical protein